MKKLLSLIGVLAISVSGASTAAVTIKTNNVTIQEQTIKNTLKFDNSEKDFFLQVNNLKERYNELSDNDKLNVANVMQKLPEQNINEIGQYLTNSNVEFIKTNKSIIETMYLVSNSFNTMSQNLSVSVQGFNVDWITLNDYIDLGLGNSNDYTPSVSKYGPSRWWKLWEWGWKIDFPEGDINVMRFVHLGFSLFNGIDFKPLESLLKSGKTFFDYLVNLDQHDKDKVAVLYDLVIKTKNDFQNSKVPFTNKFYDIFDQFSTRLEKFKILPIGFAKQEIKNAIKEETGMAIDEIGAKYSGILNTIINVASTVNIVLEVTFLLLPRIILQFIMGILSLIANQMINADANHNGVYLKFQQFIIPLGFSAR